MEDLIEHKASVGGAADAARRGVEARTPAVIKASSRSLRIDVVVSTSAPSTAPTSTINSGVERG